MTAIPPHDHNGETPDEPPSSAHYQHYEPPSDHEALDVPAMPSQQEHADAVALHYLGALLSFISPLAYRYAKPHSTYVRAHSTAALNFHLSIVVYSMSASFVSCVLGCLFSVAKLTSSFGTAYWIMIGPILLGLCVWQIVAGCIGGGIAKRGQVYRYPASFTFIK